MGTEWDERQVDLLKRLWLSGQTARTIADKLGRGVTRNAVIGKAHRLGLTGKQGSLPTDLVSRQAPASTRGKQPQRRPRPRG